MRHIEIYIKKQTYIIEIITLILYASALIMIMYYHEPWFDEAQAWLIARDATIRELLTSITHYEGHPPIWHLILMPFAKLGVSFELGIKVVNFIFATIAMGIFIFKAPFNRIIRCTIPFTYYFFYQYGVISRPYSLMMLGFVLSAMFFKERNEKPFQFVAALSLICGASAYGIVIASGIAIVWSFEIFKKSISLQEIKLFLKTKKFHALLVLLIWIILLLLLIYPYYDTFSMSNVVEKRSKALMLFYMFFIAPADATCSNVFDYSMKDINIYPYLIISCFINVIIFSVTKKFNKQALFVLPYFLFALFSGLVYFSPHHIGILTIFYMFLFWCCFAEKNEDIEIIKGRNKKYFYYIAIAVIFLVTGTSIYWSINAAINEINLNYGTDRETSEFIKNNKFERLHILVPWLQNANSGTEKKYSDYNCLEGTSSLAYFDKNIFYNLNNQANNKCYLLHKIDTDGAYVKQLIENNNPDILLWSGSNKYTFESTIRLDDYALVKSVHGNFIWKNKAYENRQLIFLRKDLLINYPSIKEIDLEKELINVE